MAQYFPPSQVDNALTIMRLESGGNPGATHYNANGSVDYGLLQINSVHSAAVGGDLNALYDPATNIRVAATIWQSGGWSQWSTARQAGL